MKRILHHRTVKLLLRCGSFTGGDDFRHSHETRHSCISLPAQAHVDQTMIKKMVGHAAAMTLTERVYAHLNIQKLVEASNKIHIRVFGQNKKQEMLSCKGKHLL